MKSQRWEYITGEGVIGNDLNLLIFGVDRWELVAVIPHPTDSKMVIYFFKRPAPPDVEGTTP